MRSIISVYSTGFGVVLMSVAAMAKSPKPAASGTAADAPSPPAAGSGPDNTALLQAVGRTHNLSPAAMERLSSIFAASPWMGQGNPKVTRHPATPEECKARLDGLKTDYANQDHATICGGPYMAPLYDPAAGQKPGDARSCIDILEFPNIPCEYPVIWVRADEAAGICEAMGKRLCDAHEWEGACAGRVGPPDYDFDAVKDIKDPGAAAGRMRALHNRREEPKKSWAYGPAERRGICAMNSTKTEGCNGGNYQACGSNTYPAGMFPECRSALGVLDQHGNAAEHMNLPLNSAQLASAPDSPLGVTEMKGSWFIWDKFQAHQDWCRWRAPYWHGSRVRDPKSHHNYHLGFRCCKSRP